MKHAKLLIFGATGMIGHRIWMEAKRSFNGEVIGTTRTNKERLYKFECFKKEDQLIEVDVSNWPSVEKILEEINPDWIVNAAGITLRKPEIKNLEHALEVNALFPRRLEKWCERNEKRMIQISTDCVFDGVNGNYTETSPYTSKENYGKTKALGEVVGSQSVTLRFSCIGRELEQKTELLEWFLTQKNPTIKGFAHVYYSGITSLVIAREVLKIIKKNQHSSGIYQIAGPVISKYDLLILANQYFNKNITIHKDEDYKSNKTLVCKKYKDHFGFVEESWEQMISDLCNDPLYKV